MRFFEKDIEDYRAEFPGEIARLPGQIGKGGTGISGLQRRYSDPGDTRLRAHRPNGRVLCAEKGMVRPWNRLKDGDPWLAICSAPLSFPDQRISLPLHLPLFTQPVPLRAHTYYNDYLTSAHLPGPEHPLTYLPLRYFCHPATLPPPPPVYSTMAEELDDFNLLSNDDQSDSYPGQPKIESSEDYLLLDDSSLASSSRNFRSRKRNRVMQSCVACHAQKRKVSLSPHPPRLPLLIPPAV